MGEVIGEFHYHLGAWWECDYYNRQGRCGKFGIWWLVAGEME